MEKEPVQIQRERELYTLSIRKIKPQHVAVNLFSLRNVRGSLTCACPDHINPNYHEKGGAGTERKRSNRGDITQRS
jgi:hypothetical protein